MNTMLPGFPPNWKSFCGPIWGADCDRFFRDALPALMVPEVVAKSAPAPENWYRALRLVAPEQVRVVILGQDPYPGCEDGEMQAHGLSFSVNSRLAAPRSLRNIFKECEADIGRAPASVDLTPWAEQGVLLLNTVLTVRLGDAGSHRGFGWESITDALIQALSAYGKNIVFVLWGNDARLKASMIDQGKHLVIESVHPSPLSARKGFFGSRPFSRANDYLAAHGRPVVEWA